MSLLASRGRYSPSFSPTVLTCSLCSDASAVMWKTVTHTSLSDEEDSDTFTPQHPASRWLITNQVATLKMSSFMEQISTVCKANEISDHCGICGAVLPECNNGSWQRRRYDLLLRVSFLLVSGICFYKPGSAWNTWPYYTRHQSNPWL